MTGPNTHGTFPRVAFATEDTTFFDIEPFVFKAVRQINLAVEAHAVEVLREAYMAGSDMAWNDTCGCISEPRDRGFDDWLDVKRQEIRCQQQPSL